MLFLFTIIIFLTICEIIPIYSAFESSVDSKITAKYQNRGLSEQEIRKKVVAEATKSKDIHSKIAGDEYQKGSGTVFMTFLNSFS